MTTKKFENVREDLTQVERHGFALYTSYGDMIAWVISPSCAKNFPGAAFIVNVQNGVSQEL